MGRPWENKSGYYDPTAHEAIETVTKEERRVTELIAVLKIISRWAGFEIINRVELRDIKSRRTYR